MKKLISFILVLVLMLSLLSINTLALSPALRDYGDINNNQIADAIYGVKLNNTLRLGYNYDAFARPSSRTLYTGNNITKTYEAC